MRNETELITQKMENLCD